MRSVRRNTFHGHRGTPTGHSYNLRSRSEVVEPVERREVKVDEDRRRYLAILEERLRITLLETIRDMRGGMRGGRPRRGRGGGAPGLGLGGPAGGGQMRLQNAGKIPFDLTYFDDIFPRVGPVPDDSTLNAMILKRNSDISPSTDEIQIVQNLVTRVVGIIETLILTPGAFDACQVDEVRQIGSFKQGTILAGHKTADFVVILRTLPTKEAVEALCTRISEELKQTECVRTTITPRGFDITSVQACVRILITTVPHNFRKLDADLHLDSKLMNEAWQAIRHSRWFEENAHNSTIKVLIRILRDMRQRYSGFQSLATWMLDLLAHYATLNNPTRQALPVNVAFRRTLSLMSGGMYLPGYAGTNIRGHSLTYEEEDAATSTAQTLLRILSHGGYKYVLGLEIPPNDIITSPTVIDGVVISPLEKVYEATPEDEKIYDEEEANEDDEGDANMEPEN